MANQIRVETSELAACAAAYRASLNTLQECVQQYHNALDALRNDYTGKAFAIMSGKVVSMLAKITGSFVRVEDAISELGATQQLFEENEAALRGKFDALDAGTKSPFMG